MGYEGVKIRLLEETLGHESVRWCYISHTFKGQFFAFDRKKDEPVHIARCFTSSAMNENQVKSRQK